MRFAVCSLAQESRADLPNLKAQLQKLQTSVRQIEGLLGKIPAVEQVQKAPTQRRTRRDWIASLGPKDDFMYLH
jgi:hypothetical protein